MKLLKFVLLLIICLGKMFWDQVPEFRFYICRYPEGERLFWNYLCEILKRNSRATSLVGNYTHQVRQRQWRFFVIVEETFYLGHEVNLNLRKRRTSYSSEDFWVQINFFHLVTAKNLKEKSEMRLYNRENHLTRLSCSLLQFLNFVCLQFFR